MLKAQVAVNGEIVSVNSKTYKNETTYKITVQTIENGGKDSMIDIKIPSEDVDGYERGQHFSSNVQILEFKGGIYFSAIDSQND